MKRINIKKKGRKFKVNPAWLRASEKGWVYYIIGGVRDQKIITKDEWSYFITFEGELQPFAIKKDIDHLQYFHAKDNMFSPAVYISHQDSKGFLHIKTEAGYFAIKIDAAK